MYSMELAVFASSYHGSVLQHYNMAMSPIKLGGGGGGGVDMFSTPGTSLLFKRIQPGLDLRNVG